MPVGRPTRWLVVLLVGALAAVAPAVQAPSAAEPPGRPSVFEPDRTVVDPTAYISVIGDEDESTSEGTQRLWRTDETIEIGGSADTRVVVRAGGQAEGYTVDLQPGLDKTLTAGRYVVSEQIPYDLGNPGMSLSGYGIYGCSEGEGSFTIYDITPDLSRLWVRFDLTCKQSVATVRGEIRIGSPPPEDLTLVSDSVHWPASVPGRAYSTQPVYVLNTGDEAVEVGRPAVTGAAFSIVRDSCETLAPGESCTIDLAFAPRTRRTETGGLRIPTSSAAQPVLDASLSGIGSVGRTYVYSRMVYPDGRTFDTQMTPDVASFRSATDGRGVGMAFPDPRRVDDFDRFGVSYDYTLLTAGPGERLRVGRTYRGRCRTDGVGPSIDLPNAACISAANGSFVVDEFERRADGTLARFRARARLRNVETSAVTTTVMAWQAEQDAAPFRPFVALDARTRIRGPGRMALTATFPTGHSIAGVELFEVTALGRVLVDSLPVDDETSQVRLDADIRADTTLVAEASDAEGGVVATSALHRVAVGVEDRPRTRTVVLRIRGARPGAAPRRPPAEATTVVLRLKPPASNGCLRVHLQRRVRSGWSNEPFAGCQRMQQRGRAVVTRRAESGALVRARLVWERDRSTIQTTSPWRTVRVRR